VLQPGFAPAFAPGEIKGLAEPSLALTLPKSPSDMDDRLLTQQAEGCEAFVSFERTFARTANVLSEVTVRAP
jgi:hypothetical protein